MSNIDNFDIDQMSLEFAHRKYLVYHFYCKKISIQSSPNVAENANVSENANCLHFY